ncbi:MAG: nucleotide exchange factor GrpE [Kiritimatiellae bacterium]|nr:nucleotide exchange factor GrpE [Kiritimatiellia bacterium]
MTHKKKKEPDTTPGEPAPAADLAAAAEAAASEKLLDQAQGEMDVMKDRMLRLQADFDNYRKRVRRDADEQRIASLEGLMRELLPVLDHLELGLQAAADQQMPEGVLDGFRLIQNQLVAALGRFHLEPIPCIGQPFDPQIHECTVTLPSDDVPKDHVLQELRRGYRLGARLLRAPQVALSSGPAGSAASETTSEG